MSGTSSVIVREATREDVDRVAPLFDAYRQFYGRSADLPLAREFLANRLSRGESVVFLASTTDGIDAGFVQVYRSFSSLRAAPIWILNDLFVVPAQRRAGVARVLMDFVTTSARKAGVMRLKLSTAKTNLPAQALYESLDWQREGDFLEYNLSLWRGN